MQFIDGILGEFYLYDKVHGIRSNVTGMSHLKKAHGVRCNNFVGIR